MLRNPYVFSLSLLNTWKILFVFLLSISMYSCQQNSAPETARQTEPEGTPASVWLKKDTLKIQLIDSLVGMTKERVYKDGTAKTVTYYFDNAPVDSADVSTYNGELINVSYRYFDPAQEVWNDIFIRQGEVFFVRHREWNKRPEAHSAREIFFYFQGGQLEYAKERYKVLGPENIPADLLWEPMLDYSRTLESAQSYLDRFWPTMRTLVEQKLASGE